MQLHHSSAPRMRSELSPGQPIAPPDGQEWPVWSAALTSLSPGGGEGGGGSHSRDTWPQSRQHLKPRFPDGQTTTALTKFD